jgi:ketosteroid isomerase-like protein
MNKSILFSVLLSSLLTLAMSKPAPAADNGHNVNPASLAERDLTAQSRGDVAAALALYNDDAIVQGGGLCWTPCVGKAAIQKELQRRAAANNHATIIGKYVSDNVAVVKSAVRLGSTNKSGVYRSIEWSPGVDRIVVWNIYEARGDKIAVVTLVGQRTDPQTARFIAWLRSQQQPAR